MNWEAISWFLFWSSLALCIISWVSWSIDLDYGGDGIRQRRATIMFLVMTFVLGILAFGSI